MLRHRIDNIVHLEDTVSMIEFSIPDSWVGKNLIQLDLRNKYALNLIGIRRKNLTTLDTDINPSEVFEPNTKVVVIASDNTFEKFDYLGYLK